MRSFILDAFRSMFRSGPRFPMGALRSPEDKRNIALASFQVPVGIPDDFEIELPRVKNQGAKPKCVASAITILMEYYFAKRGFVTQLSDDDLYAQCKAEDGIPDTPGTFPSVGARMAQKYGVASESAFETGNTDAILKSRAERKIGGYAFVSPVFEEVCQAVYQNGAVTVTMAVDSNFFRGIMQRVFAIIGEHHVVWNGATVSKGIIKGQNSWGLDWVGYIAGVFNPSVKPGKFHVRFEDVRDTAHDIIAFTDIPPEILKDVKDKPYYFKRTLKRGNQGQDVLELQKRLDREGFWSGEPFASVYGPATARAVMLYQIQKGIIAKPADSDNGNLCGPRTIRALNGELGLSLEEAIIQVESEGNLWAVGDLHLANKAYGCMQIRKPVCDDVNARFKTARKPEDMLGNKEISLDTFRKYVSIYEPSGTDEAKARLWNAGPNWRAKKSLTDKYWQKVLSKMQ